jgi:hypothetical protein
MPREFRTQESYHTETNTREMIPSFLRERGFREVDDQRKKYGQNQAQTIRAIDDLGQQVAMGVRLCWCQRGSKAEEHFAAAQLLAGIDGGDWIGSLTAKMEREKHDDNTHLLVVPARRQRHRPSCVSSDRRDGTYLVCSERRESTASGRRQTWKTERIMQ